MLGTRTGILAALAAAVAALPAAAPAQQPPLSETLAINGQEASTWNEETTRVAAFSGPVRIQLDQVNISADAAVMWVSPAQGVVPDTQLVEIALVGNAALEHGPARRTGDRLFVTARVRGPIRISAQRRLTRDLSHEELYQSASSLREQIGFGLRSEVGQWRMPRPSPFVEQPETKRIRTTPADAVSKQVRMQVDKGYTLRMPDGTIAVVVDRGLSVTIRTEPDQVTQLLADRGVVFTSQRDLAAEESLEAETAFEDAIESVYLEGDVRILFSPKSSSRPDSQLEASHVFYEIATDRAVLTDAVLHTMDPSSKVPIVIRASTMKQLSRDEDHAEFRLHEAQLTTSSFATPSYAVASDRAYVRQVETHDWFGTKTTFSGRQNTLGLWGIPVLWLPYAGGTVTDRGFPLRSIEIGATSRFGFLTRTEWGFFESIGRNPPRDLDLTYRADYLSDRGPATGVNAKYRGSSISDTTREPNSFAGELGSYFVYDQGEDQLGNRRDVVPPDEMRGRLFWQHQQFLPDDWQVQLRTGWISDATFLEEYFPDEFRGIEAQDTSLYAKHQRDSEAVTLLLQTQPNNIVSTHEFAQENYEIERLPELGYHRIADDLNGETITLYSNNSISRLGYDPNKDDYVEMGYPRPVPNREYLPAGLPSTGYTGFNEDYVNRGDFRQEVALPFTMDRFRVQPYVMGRYTGYDDSPEDGNLHRGFAGAGTRITTAFWRTNDQIESEMWDIHRMRHVIEPELHLFGSVTGTEREEVFIFDEQTDAISDVTAAQVAIRQKWQTKRGGPGNWHSGDVFTWNTDVTFYGNKPEDRFLFPEGFRGLFFPSMPETSIPRDSINSDQLWRISDSTTILADQQYNLDESRMATSSIGVAVRRGNRITYFLGERYINELDSNIVSFMVNYELSTRYLLGMSQSYDFGDDENVNSNFNVTRRFDRFYVALSLTVNEETGDTGVFVTLRPNYAPSGVGTSNLPAALQ